MIRECECYAECPDCLTEYSADDASTECECGGEIELIECGNDGCEQGEAPRHE